MPNLFVDFNHVGARIVRIGLPGINGYEVCRRVRATSWGKNLVMLALTGWGQDEDRRRSRDAGFNGHLVKPVDYQALTELLNALPATVSESDRR